MAQEDLSGVHGMRGHPLSQILSKTSGLGTVWHGWGPDPVHWGDTQGRGPSTRGFMWYQGMVFLLLSLPDPFLSARVDSVLETRSEVSVSPVGASTGAPCRFREAQVILCPQVAAECPAGTEWAPAEESGTAPAGSEWPGPETGAGRGQLLPVCGGQSARVGGRG